MLLRSQTKKNVFLLVLVCLYLTCSDGMFIQETICLLGNVRQSDRNLSDPVSKLRCIYVTWQIDILLRHNMMTLLERSNDVTRRAAVRCLSFPWAWYGLSFKWVKEQKPRHAQ